MSELVLDSVTVDRGQGPIVSDVSVTVAAGSVTALIGPNGAGKTTLLESVSGMISVASGSVTFDGVDIKRLSRRLRAHLGLAHVEQGRAIFPSLTVLENISLGAKSAASLEAALAPFPELEKRLSIASGLLSGGEQQMLVLARALATRPRVLLIDEMSLGLAPVVFLRLLPVVQEVADSGVGVLLVEQFAQHALAISDRALVLSGGSVGYAGSASALLDDPDLLVKVYLG